MCVPDQGGSGVPDRLPPESIAIRGGEDMSPAVLAAAFEDHHVKATDSPERGLLPGYCLSVNSAPGLSVEDLALLARRPNPRVCFTTVGDIENAGFVVVPTQASWTRNGHCDVYSQEGPERMPTPSELQALQHVFRGPIPNPARAQ